MRREFLVYNPWVMTDTGKLLLVDDDTTALSLMRELLEERGYSIDCAAEVDQAEELLSANAYRVVVTDLKMPGRSGMDLVSTCRRDYPETPVIMITGHGTIRNAVDALKSGAFEYLSKPVQMDELEMVIGKAIRSRRLETQNTFLRQELERTLGYLYETASPRLQDIYQTVNLIRDEDSSVLIQGESGTGKEVIARLIHNSGRRSRDSFVPINCGAIPENLIESELFGFEKGAFTGASKRTPGKLEIADGGTLFLDEVNELPGRAQVALLRFIQEREIVPLGSNRRVQLNVRFITATNRNLQELVSRGEFREDLYYRINVLPLSLPPLRERKEDIIPLSRWFLDRFREISPRRAAGFSADAEEALKAYHWPGNIRELRNVVDRATLLCRTDMVNVPALGLPGAPARPGTGPCGDFGITDNSATRDIFSVNEELSLREMEDRYLRWILSRYDGNRTRTARALGISVRGLRYKLNAEEEK